MMMKGKGYISASIFIAAIGACLLVASHAIESRKAEQESQMIGLPVRIKIPAMSIDAYVELQGLAKDGSIAVSEGPEDVSWFDLGPRPGQLGSAIIVGHYGWKDHKKAVFDDLGMLKPGDIVIVTDDRGLASEFMVRKTVSYEGTSTRPEVFASKVGSHLNLISCSGAWDAVTRTYSERLVVFTDLIK